MNQTEETSPGRKRRNFLVRTVRSRDFSRDIIVTTLGVLIALGIGALVDEWRWRMRLGAVKRVMSQEFGLVRGTYAERFIASRCILEKLAALDEVVEEARTTHRLPEIRQIGLPPDHGAYGDSWTLAQSSDVMLHLEPEEAMKIASTWVNVRYVTDAITRQGASFKELQDLSDRPGRVSDDLIDQSKHAINSAFMDEDQLYFLALRDDERWAKDVVPRLATNSKAFDAAETRKASAHWSLCKPLLVDGKPYRLKKPVELNPLPKDLAP